MMIITTSTSTNNNINNNNINNNNNNNYYYYCHHCLLCANVIYYINQNVLWEFPPLRKTESRHVKNDDQFPRVRDSQSVPDTSLPLSSATNEWQGILFLKREFSRLLVVGKAFI